MFFHKVSVASASFSLQIVSGSICFKWWLKSVRDETLDELHNSVGTNPKTESPNSNNQYGETKFIPISSGILPCRLVIHLVGVKYSVFCAKEKYDSIQKIVNEQEKNKACERILEECLQPNENSKVPVNENAITLPLFYKFCPALNFIVQDFRAVFGNPDLESSLNATSKSLEGIHLVRAVNNRCLYRSISTIKAGSVNIYLEQNLNFQKKESLQEMLHNDLDREDFVSAAIGGLKNFLNNGILNNLSLMHTFKSSSDTNKVMSPSFGPIAELTSHSSMNSEFRPEISSPLEGYSVNPTRRTSNFHMSDDQNNSGQERADIASCDLLILTYYYDFQRSIQINDAYEDAPRYGLNISFKTPVTLIYGPWANSQRRIMMEHFFPFPYQHVSPFSLDPGKIWEPIVLSLSLNFVDTIRLCIPFSLDGKKNRSGHSLTNNLESYLEIFAKGSSFIDITVPWYPLSDEGCSTVVNCKINQPIIKTFDPDALINRNVFLKSTQELSIVCDLHYPNKWNDPAVWKFSFSFKATTLNLLRDFFDFFSILSECWSSYAQDVGLDFFIPISYEIGIFIDECESLFFVNEGNIMKPDNESSILNSDLNSCLKLNCQSLELHLSIPFLHYCPSKSTISYSISLKHVNVELSLPKMHPWSELYKSPSSKQFILTQLFKISGIYMYHYQYHTQNIDCFDMELFFKDSIIQCDGHFIRFFLNWIYNFLGSDRSCITFEEFVSYGFQNFKYKNACFRYYADGNRNESEANILIRTETTSFQFPQSFCSIDRHSKPTVRVLDLAVDLRMVSKYFDMSIISSPMTLSIPSRNSEDSSNFIQLPTLNYHWHTDYGPSPNFSVFKSTDSTSISKLTGVLSISQVNTVISSVRAIQNQWQDSADQSLFNPSVIPFKRISSDDDILYSLADVRSVFHIPVIDFEIRLGNSSAFLLQISGLEASSDSIICEKSSRQTRIQLPDVKLYYFPKVQSQIEEPAFWCTTSFQVSVIEARSDWQHAAKQQQDYLFSQSEFFDELTQKDDLPWHWMNANTISNLHSQDLRVEEISSIINTWSDENQNEYIIRNQTALKISDDEEDTDSMYSVNSLESDDEKYPGKFFDIDSVISKDASIDSPSVKLHLPSRLIPHQLKTHLPKVQLLPEDSTYENLVTSYSKNQFRTLRTSFKFLEEVHSGTDISTFKTPWSKYDKLRRTKVTSKRASTQFFPYEDNDLNSLSSPDIQLTYSLEFSETPSSIGGTPECLWCVESLLQVFYPESPTTESLLDDIHHIARGIFQSPSGLSVSRITSTSYLIIIKELNLEFCQLLQIQHMQQLLPSFLYFGLKDLQLHVRQADTSQKDDSSKLTFWAMSCHGLTLNSGILSSLRTEVSISNFLDFEDSKKNRNLKGALLNSVSLLCNDLRSSGKIHFRNSSECLTSNVDAFGLISNVNIQIAPSTFAYFPLVVDIWVNVIDRLSNVIVMRKNTALLASIWIFEEALHTGCLTPNVISHYLPIFSNWLLAKKKKCTPDVLGVSLNDLSLYTDENAEPLYINNSHGISDVLPLTIFLRKTVLSRSSKNRVFLAELLGTTSAETVPPRFVEIFDDFRVILNRSKKDAINEEISHVLNRTMFSFLAILHHVLVVPKTTVDFQLEFNLKHIELNLSSNGFRSGLVLRIVDWTTFMTRMITCSSSQEINRCIDSDFKSHSDLNSFEVELGPKFGEYLKLIDYVSLTGYFIKDKHAKSSYKVISVSNVYCAILVNHLSLTYSVPKVGSFSLDCASLSFTVDHITKSHVSKSLNINDRNFVPSFFAVLLKELNVSIFDNLKQTIGKLYSDKISLQISNEDLDLLKTAHICLGTSSSIAVFNFVHFRNFDLNSFLEPALAILMEYSKVSQVFIGRKRVIVASKSANTRVCVLMRFFQPKLFIILPTFKFLYTVNDVSINYDFQSVLSAYSFHLKLASPKVADSHQILFETLHQDSTLYEFENIKQFIFDLSKSNFFPQDIPVIFFSLVCQKNCASFNSLTYTTCLYVGKLFSYINREMLRSIKDIAKVVNSEIIEFSTSFSKFLEEKKTRFSDLSPSNDGIGQAEFHSVMNLELIFEAIELDIAISRGTKSPRVIVNIQRIICEYINQNLPERALDKSEKDNRRQKCIYFSMNGLSLVLIRPRSSHLAANVESKLASYEVEHFMRKHSPLVYDYLINFRLKFSTMFEFSTSAQSNSHKGLSIIRIRKIHCAVTPEGFSQLLNMWNHYKMIVFSEEEGTESEFDNKSSMAEKNFFQMMLYDNSSLLNEIDFMLDIRSVALLLDCGLPKRRFDIGHHAFFHLQGVVSTIRSIKKSRIKDENFVDGTASFEFSKCSFSFAELKHLPFFNLKKLPLDQEFLCSANLPKAGFRAIYDSLSSALSIRANLSGPILSIDSSLGSDLTNFLKNSSWISKLPPLNPSTTESSRMLSNSESSHSLLLNIDLSCSIFVECGRCYFFSKRNERFIRSSKESGTKKVKPLWQTSLPEIKISIFKWNSSSNSNELTVTCDITQSRIQIPEDFFVFLEDFFIPLSSYSQGPGSIGSVHKKDDRKVVSKELTAGNSLNIGVSLCVHPFELDVVLLKPEKLKLESYILNFRLLNDVMGSWSYACFPDDASLFLTASSLILPNMALRLVRNNLRQFRPFFDANVSRIFLNFSSLDSKTAHLSKNFTYSSVQKISLSVDLSQADCLQSISFMLDKYQSIQTNGDGMSTSMTAPAEPKLVREHSAWSYSLASLGQVDINLDCTSLRSMVCNLQLKHSFSLFKKLNVEKVGLGQLYLSKTITNPIEVAFVPINKNQGIVGVVNTGKFGYFASSQSSVMLESKSMNGKSEEQASYHVQVEGINLQMNWQEESSLILQIEADDTVYHAVYSMLDDENTFDWLAKQLVITISATSTPLLLSIFEDLDTLKKRMVLSPSVLHTKLQSSEQSVLPRHPSQIDCRGNLNLLSNRVELHFLKETSSKDFIALIAIDVSVELDLLHSESCTSIDIGRHDFDDELIREKQNPQGGLYLVHVKPDSSSNLIMEIPGICFVLRSAERLPQIVLNFDSFIDGDIVVPVKQGYYRWISDMMNLYVQNAQHASSRASSLTSDPSSLSSNPAEYRVSVGQFVFKPKISLMGELTPSKILVDRALSQLGISHPEREIPRALYDHLTLNLVLAFEKFRRHLQAFRSHH